jgi:hypothetical protein
MRSCLENDSVRQSGIVRRITIFVLPCTRRLLLAPAGARHFGASLALSKVLANDFGAGVRDVFPALVTSLKRLQKHHGNQTFPRGENA